MEITKIYSNWQNKIYANKMLLRSGISLVFRVLGIAASYWLFYLVSKLGGVAESGEFFISFNFLFLLGQIAAIGIPSSILRFSGALVGKGDWIGIKKLYRKVSIVIISVSGILGLLVVLLSKIIATYVYHNPGMEISFILSGLAVPFVAINLTNVMFIRTFNLIHISELFLTAALMGLSSLLILISWWVIKRADMFNLYICACIVTSIASTFVVRKLVSEKCRDMEEFEDEVTIKKIIHTSFPMMITSISLLMMMKMDSLILGYFCTPEDVGIYQVAMKIATTTNIFNESISIVVGPQLSNYYWSNDKESVKSVVRKAAQFIFWSSIPVVLVLSMFSRMILSIFGHDFVSGVSILLLLISGQVVVSFTGAVGYYMNMTGKQSNFRNIVGVTLITGTILKLLLIKYYGYNGAAFASVVTIITWNIWCVIYIFKKDGVYVGFNPFTRYMK